MATNASFYADLLNDAKVRNQLQSVEECQTLIDLMEDDVPHDELPDCYDWLVARRNRLAGTPPPVPASASVR